MCPFASCTSAGGDASAPRCHLGQSGEHSRERFAKNHLCLFNNRHFGFFLYLIFEGDGVAAEPIRGRKSDNVLEKEGYPEMRIMEIALDFYSAIMQLKKYLALFYKGEN